MMIAFHKIISRKAAPGVYHGPPIFFSPSTLLNSKIGFTSATAGDNGYCAFKYPSGFANSNSALLCVRYKNSSSRPITESATADFWGGDFSISGISATKGTEVTAILLKI